VAVSEAVEASDDFFPQADFGPDQAYAHLARLDDPWNINTLQ